MRVTFKAQRHLMLFHRAGDDGEWVAVCCKAGAAELIGKRLKAGETITGTLTFTPDEPAKPTD